MKHLHFNCNVNWNRGDSYYRLRYIDRNHWTCRNKSPLLTNHPGVSIATLLVMGLFSKILAYILVPGYQAVDPLMLPVLLEQLHGYGQGPLSHAVEAVSGVRFAHS